MSIDAPKGRRKASECFPDDVKEFIVNMKSDNKPYVEIVEETKKKFPGLVVKLHHCREIVLANSAHVSLTVEDKFFVPFKRNYAASLDIPQKCILLMDNAPVHGRNINEDVLDVEVIFLPPNTTSLLQPMDQTVNRSFKSIYLKKLMRKAIEACDAGEDLNTFFSSMEIDIAIDLVH